MTTDPLPLSPADLDAAYTRLCRLLTQAGPELTPLVLARFALLAMTRIGDAAVVDQLLSDAAQGLVGDSPAADA